MARDISGCSDEGVGGMRKPDLILNKVGIDHRREPAGDLGAVKSFSEVILAARTSPEAT